MNRRFLLLLTITVALTAILSGPARAETDDDFARVLEAIQRNQELLEQATELVRQTSSVKARTSLRTAETLHKESVSVVEAGPGGGRCALAAELAKRAREALLQTVSIARREARIADRALRTIERATFRLDDLKQRLSENPDVAAPRKLAEEAHGQLQRSQHNMREHLYEVALRLAISSNELSERGIALLKDNIDNPDALIDKIERTDRIIERVSEQLTSDSPAAAHNLLDEARSIQRKAKEQLRADRPRAAFDLTHRARDTAFRAGRMLAGAVDPESVERALQLTDALVSTAQDVSADQNIDALTRRVEQASQLQRNARDQFVDGAYEQALNMTLRARGMLKDALARVKKHLNEKDVLAALERTDALLSRVQEQVASSGDATARDILERARGQQVHAWEEYRSERLRPALTHTRLARNLAQRALRQTDENN